eukprot:14844569-Alexandrium_andersonii.AAC.1
MPSALGLRASLPWLGPVLGLARLKSLPWPLSAMVGTSPVAELWRFGPFRLGGPRAPHKRGRRPRLIVSRTTFG